MRVNVLGPFRYDYDNYWASVASPTLGCSIEISRDIYMYMCVCRGPKCARRITWPNTRMLKVSLGPLKQTCDTRVIHYNYYARPALAWTKKKRSLRNEKLKANRTSVIEEQRKEMLRIRRENKKTENHE